MPEPGTELEQPATADLEKAVEKFLAPLMDGLRENMEAVITARVAKLEETLAKPAEAQEQPAEAPKGKTESALDQRIKALEQQLSAEKEARTTQEKAAQSLRFDQALGTNLDGFSPLHKTIVQEVLANRLKTDAIEKDGQWLTKDGRTLTEATKAFFETPEGMHFLPTNHKDGAGIQQPGQIRSEGSTLSLADQISQAFQL